MSTTRVAVAAAESIGGMLWYIAPAARGTTIDWREEILQAAEFYHAKYVRFPTTIRMNPADFTSAGFSKLGNMNVVSDKNTIERHVLVTEEGKSK